MTTAQAEYESLPEWCRKMIDGLRADAGYSFYSPKPMGGLSSAAGETNSLVVTVPSQSFLDFLVGFHGAFRLASELNDKSVEDTEGEAA